MAMKRKSIPYANTKISPEDTKAAINKLLKAHGIEGIQWTDYQGQTVLKFIFKAEVKGVEKEIMYQFKPPNIPRKRRYVHRTVAMDDWSSSYRLLFWFLKTMLEAVEFGLDSVEHVFMSHIVVALPNGQVSTLGEKLEDVAEMVGLPIFGERKALPEGQATMHTIERRKSE